jgi:hypothetical protein
LFSASVIYAKISALKSTSVPALVVFGPPESNTSYGIPTFPIDCRFEVTEPNILTLRWRLVLGPPSAIMSSIEIDIFNLIKFEAK